MGYYKNLQIELELYDFLVGRQGELDGFLVDRQGDEHYWPTFQEEELEEF